MLEVLAMGAALVMMFACVVAKIVTAHLLARMRWNVGRVAHELQRVHRELGSAKSQQGSIAMNRSQLEHRRDKIKKRTERLRAELASIQQAELHRRQLLDAARGGAAPTAVPDGGNRPG